MLQKNVSRALLLFIFALTLVSFQSWRTEAHAESSFFNSRGCVDCHGAPTAATCAGCHEHSGSLTATKNKTTSYAPGETVTITMTASGARSGWIGARLYNQSGVEVARSTGNQSGMGGSTTYPAVLSAPAPATAGTYTWKIAYLGNQNGSGAGDVHAEKSVNVSITVAAPAPSGDSTKPVVGTFTLPASATSLTVPVTAFSATDNVAVTGYQINKSATAPLASAAGWSASAPASVTAVAGTNTFYAWAKDTAGNVSLAKSASVVVTIAPPAPVADTTKPALTISALANGTYTNKVTLNISGSASDAGGLKSVTVNGQAAAVNANGSFSAALNLVAGANTVTVVASDNAGNQTSDVRTINYDLTAPVLAVSAPGDNSNSAQSFVTVTGTVNETSTVSVADNGGSQQSAVMNGSNFSATVNLVAGVNTLTITATDLAGNTASAKRTVTFEGGKITLAVTRPNQDITTQRSKLSIRGSVVDAVGKVAVTVSVDGRSYTPRVNRGSFQQTVNFRTPKTYTITVTAKDAAGNSSSVSRNVIFSSEVRGDDDDDNNNSSGSTGGSTTSHPFGWSNPRSSHQDYAKDNGVAGCISCHSIDQASKGQPMSCYNCHGKEWETPSTGGSTGGSTSGGSTSGGSTSGGSTTSHPFGWSNPRSSHQDYAKDNGVASCISCHSIDQASKGQPMSCYNCHGKEWDTPSTAGSTGGSTTGGSTSGGSTTSHPFGWSSPRSSHQNADFSVSNCTSCHSTSESSEGQAMSCYNCHGKEW